MEILNSTGAAVVPVLGLRALPLLASYSIFSLFLKENSEKINKPKNSEKSAVVAVLLLTIIYSLLIVKNDAVFFTINKE